MIWVIWWAKTERRQNQHLENTKNCLVQKKKEKKRTFPQLQLTIHNRQGVSQSASQCDCVQVHSRGNVPGKCGEPLSHGLQQSLWRSGPVASVENSFPSHTPSHTRPKLHHCTMFSLYIVGTDNFSYAAATWGRRRHRGRDASLHPKERKSVYNSTRRITYSNMGVHLCLLGLHYWNSTALMVMPKE